MNAPERTFLMWDAEHDMAIGNTVSTERINDSDIEYVRADIVTAKDKEIAKLMRAVETVCSVHSADPEFVKQRIAQAEAELAEEAEGNACNAEFRETGGR